MAAIGLLASVDASAQFAMPAPTGGTSPAVDASSMTLVTGQQKIAEVKKAIAGQDYHTAVESYRIVWAMQSKFPQLAGELQSLRTQLESIGIDGALLSMPPKPPIALLPDVANAIPMSGFDGSATLSNPKQEALRLVAIGRAALDRGDVTTAITVARKAEALKVPEKDFAPGEPRVWQLVLDVESAARRNGISQVSGQSTAGAPSYVQPAIASGNTANNNAVSQMLYAAETGNGAVQQVQAFEPLAGNRNAIASGLFSDGMKSLTDGNKSDALKKFREAWKYEADLDPTQRQLLKDKLTLLQPTRLGSVAAAKSDGELSPIDKAELESQEKTRRLYREVTSELAKTEQSKIEAPLDSLDQLERLRRRVDGSDIDESAKRSLAVMVNRAVAEQNRYIEANRAKINLDLQNDAVRMQMEQDDAREARIEQEVSQIVEDFNVLVKEGRFEEAEVLAKQVQELLPGDQIAVAMLQRSRIGTRIRMGEEIRDLKADSYLDQMLEVERSSIVTNPDRPVTWENAEDWESLSRRRLGKKGQGDPRLSAAENEIRDKLSTPVNIKYRNRPLGEVMDELSAVTGVPIVIDERALGAVRVTAETPVTLQLQNEIMFKSALNIILQQLELTHVIENDVLTITSIESKRSKVYPVTYRVTDLVTPIPNFTTSYDDGLAGALRNAYQMSNPQTDVHVVPVSATDLGTGMARQMSPMNMSGSNVLGQYSPMGAQGSFGMGNPPGGGGGAGGASFANFDSLIELIQTTVVPDTWDLLGGPSTMREYAQNLSLVISTTSDVHDQIADLLESLRRLQNLQITIEVRFITLSDTFAEQIGVDFDLSFDDNTRNIPDDDAGPSITVGYDGQAITSDLDIKFNNGNAVVPAFGGIGVANPSTLGFAILSDIEAFFFLQAVQSDSRTNVMQAPKVTLFDGQFASISDVTQRPFVTSITPVVGDFAVAQQPVIVVLNEGTQLNVQGLVSDDKRFVRLTLVPFFSQIGNVDTFTYEGSRTSNNSSRSETDTNGDGVIDEQDEVDTENSSDIITGTTVQLPTFAFTSVSTTVSVPDGGTILLGGIKRMSEGRVERGTPLLSKIPYVSRLFRNVATSRTASSLMLMVTPRIIIQEEEELAQTGFNPASQ
ncbi:Bacterial type II and III secretion system protein [Rubripirellula tenax]|uniref:Bacterial type II and III secretion system protein n=2 Tax=Rubripirellula tenax TaxID=2528015 RepID=A0A5C6F582_9BACT|nr:Bacterial type II and III secretion system protein [Rubripirellula tenax]